MVCVVRGKKFLKKVTVNLRRFGMSRLIGEDFTQRRNYDKSKRLLVYCRCSEEQLPVVFSAGAETDPEEAINNRQPHLLLEG